VPRTSRPAQESTPLREREPFGELPTDLSELAVILESAMAGGAADAQVTSGNLQVPSSKFQVSSTEPDEAETEGRASDPELEPPTLDVPAPVRADGANRSGAASEREAIAFDEVARSLAAAEACVPLLAQATGLMRLAALDVVKAETARAGGLLQLLRFLRGDISLPVTSVSTAVVIQRLTQAAEAERRLRGISLVTRSSVADATCAGDETLLTNTVLALLLITFGLLEGVQNARVTLAVTVNENNEIGLAVSQDHVPAPASWTAETASGELPGDAARVVPAIALKAAHRLAREWRGRFALATGEHSSILTLWLPMIQPAAGGPLPS
jgi:hypothetical protein